LATVILQTEFARRYTGGQTRLTVAATDYSALIETLEARFPGFEDSLQGGMAVAIDGEIYQSPLLEKIGTESEVYFLPPIGGG
jgi:molybdopterin converting factor small subunit